MLNSPFSITPKPHRGTSQKYHISNLKKLEGSGKRQQWNETKVASKEHKQPIEDPSSLAF